MTEREARRLIIAARRLERAAVAKDRERHQYVLVRSNVEVELRKSRRWLTEVVNAIIERREPARYGKNFEPGEKSE